jgi:hypothetical protein
MNWSSMTPREMRNALRTAPKILTAWREIRLAPTLTLARCEPLDNEGGRCDQGNPVAWVRRDRWGSRWHWSIDWLGYMPVVPKSYGTENTETEARAKADELLAKEGYTLDNEGNP